MYFRHAAFLLQDLLHLMIIGCLLKLTPQTGFIRTIFPRRSPAVQIRFTGTERGRGLFANRNLTRDQIIIEESPILTSNHGLLRVDWNLTTLTTRQETVNLFSRLAQIPTDRALVANESFETILEDFKRDYAFQDPAGRRALIYRNASHINHACRYCANAEWIIDAEEPHQIMVRATKRIRANKEIFINYGWGNLPFACSECARKRAKRNAKLARRERFNRKLKGVAMLFNMPQMQCFGGSNHSIHSA
jgi:hypothetical protein